MRTAALALLLGTLAVHALPLLPARNWCIALPLVAALALWPRLPWPLRLPAVALSGLLWTLWRLPDPGLALPPAYDGQTFVLEGRIAALPDREGRRLELELETTEARAADATLVPLAGRVRLAWYEAPAEDPPQVGERWRFTARLRAPYGFANPGGFDRERHLYASGVVARGSVRSQPPPARLAGAEAHLIDRLRARFAAALQRLRPADPGTAILAALTIGEEGAISTHQWETFRRTGTTHLMAISGQQIALVAGLMFVAVRALWARLPGLAARLAPVRAGALAALLSALGYALIAGMGLPVRRALIMVAVGSLALLAGRELLSTRTLALALIAVLLGDPLAPLSYGFWLSFGAVALILYLHAGRLDGRGPTALALRLQWAISLGMLPATIVLFGQLPLVSPFANLLAIPWADLLIVPFALAGLLASLMSDTLAGPLLDLAGLTTRLLLGALDTLARPDWAARVVPTPPLWTLALALPGVAWWLAPPGFPSRRLGLLLCLPLLAWDWPHPPAGGFRLASLDAGSGLAVVVETAGHTLLFDAGPRLGSTDAGRLVVLPYLQSRGIRRIDALVLTHLDASHIGGARSVRAALPVGAIFVPDPLAMPAEGAASCVAGGFWIWDDVRFEWLHPPPGHGAGEARSCVLKVSGAGGSALLIADLDAGGSRRLLAGGARLAADTLLAPYQGTKPPPAGLLAAVRPGRIWLSTGRGNRWGHPKPEVLAAWAAAGAQLDDTAAAGALLLDVPANATEPPLLTRWRETDRRYWRVH